MRNILSIDLEGSIEGKSAIYNNKTILGEDKKSLYEIRKNLDIILEFLNTHKVKATFFTLSRIIKLAPEIGLQIIQNNHELASHGFRHLFLDQMSDKEIEEYVYSSKSIIEDATGSKIYGFRAPFFSVGRKKELIFDTLAKNNYVYDSSIFPIKGHDLYGCYWDSPNEIKRLNNGLIEMPLSTLNVLGKNFPALGGGYLRLLPISFTRFSLKHLNNNNKVGLVYIHPYEIGGNYSEHVKSNFLQKIRFYRNIGNVTRQKMTSLFNISKFTSHYEFLKDQKFC